MALLGRAVLGRLRELVDNHSAPAVAALDRHRPFFDTAIARSSRRSCCISLACSPAARAARTRSPTQSSRTRASPGPFAVRDNLTLECENGDDADAGKKLADPPLQKPSSQPTLRWRKMDSNL